MGHVYEAQREDGTRAAIKVLHSHLLTSPEVSFRFRREGEILESISSPHVPRLLGRGKDDKGRPFFALELVEGKVLDHLLHEQERLPMKVAVELAAQMCRALRAAHAAGVVHRDMKPDNVIVCGSLEEPLVKVLDFSVSKTEDLAFTQRGEVIGTPAYMPPEQAKGDPITPLADVYSVGAILYDMLTGRPPYEADEPGKVLAALLTTDPPKPRELVPTIDPQVEAIVLKAIARDPARRYPLIEALGEALEQVGVRLQHRDDIPTAPPDEALFDPPPGPQREPTAAPYSWDEVVAPARSGRVWLITLAVAVAAVLLAIALLRG